MAPRDLWRPGPEDGGAAGGRAVVTVKTDQYVGNLLLQASREQPSGNGDEQQVRLHPGIIAAVVVVAMLALLAAILIIKKYCFPESNVTYRYSTLRNHHEDLDNSATTRLQEDSDEDLLD
ncbi:sortilin-like [Ranitomeya imitator]|uniref:sortilin-like n=1 Tax=Ranitomeya imitator TaxID=111125 RepID=UPI0037E9182B